MRYGREIDEEEVRSGSPVKSGPEFVRSRKLKAIIKKNDLATPYQN